MSRLTELGVMISLSSRFFANFLSAFKKLCKLREVGVFRGVYSSFPSLCFFSTGIPVDGSSPTRMWRPGNREMLSRIDRRNKIFEMRGGLLAILVSCVRVC